MSVAEAPPTQDQAVHGKILIEVHFGIGRNRGEIVSGHGDPEVGDGDLLCHLRSVQLSYV